MKSTSRKSPKTPTAPKPYVAAYMGLTERLSSKQPRLRITWDAPVANNIAMATIMGLAAAVYEARPSSDSWLVNVPHGISNIGGGRTGATITIETVTGKDEEAADALATLLGLDGVIGTNS